MSEERDELGSIDRPVIARRLDKYAEGGEAATAVQRNHMILLSAQQSVARMLQHQVGSDVVILYKGKAWIPYTGSDGKRCGYDEMTVYDLDAALIGLACDPPQPEVNGDGA